MVVGFITSYAKCLSPLTLSVRIALMGFILDATLCDKVCQWLAAVRWFSQGIPLSSTNETDSHDITEILLTVALSTIPEATPKLTNGKYIFGFHCLTLVSLCQIFSDIYSGFFSTIHTPGSNLVKFSYMVQELCPHVYLKRWNWGHPCPMDTFL